MTRHWEVHNETDEHGNPTTGTRDLAVLSSHGQRGSGSQDLFEDFSLVELRTTQGPTDREAVQGADQV
jgi:hypothetical protein